MKYKVGDKVKIRSWNSMKQEYGTNKDGSIKTLYVFISDKKYCEKVVTIEEVNTRYYKIKEDNKYKFWTDKTIDHNATRILSIINRLKKLRKLISDIEKPFDMDIKVVIDAQIKVLKSKKPYFTEKNITFYNEIFHEIKIDKFKGF